MNIESNVSKISEQMALYQSISVVLLVLAVIFTIAAVVVWFVFKIPHSFKVLTGIGAGRELEKIKSDTRAGIANISVNDNRAVLNWNTTGYTKPAATVAGNMSGSEETELLQDVYDGSEETQLLTDLDLSSEETVLLSDLIGDDEKTTVLNSGFEIEEEIKFTGADQLL